MDARDRSVRGASSSERSSPSATLRAGTLRLVVPFVLGCAGAIAGNFLTGSAQRPPSAARDEGAPPRSAELEVRVERSSAIDDLERRLAALEGRENGDDTAAGESPAPGTTAAPTAPAPSPAEEFREIADLHRRLSAEFEAAPEDPAWSERATSAFSADVQHLSDQAGVRLRTLRCRGHRCRAEVAMETPGIEGIARTTRAVMSHQFALNCQRTVYFVDHSVGGDDHAGFIDWNCAPTQLPGPAAVPAGI